MRFFLSVFLVVLTTTVFAADTHRMNVSATASVYKPADKLSIFIGVETMDKNAEKAIEANKEKMNSVASALKKLGLSATEIESKEFIITPQETPAPKNPPENWQPSIAGYLVRNTLEIRTSKLELAGKIVDVSSENGANYIQHLAFSLEDEETAKSDAIAKAYKRAKEYAETAMREAGVKLGDVIDITVSHPLLTYGTFKTRIGGTQETPISPRDIEVKATVSIVYEICSGMSEKK